MSYRTGIYKDLESEMAIRPKRKLSGSGEYKIKVTFCILRSNLSSAFMSRFLRLYIFTKR